MAPKAEPENDELLMSSSPGYPSTPVPSRKPVVAAKAKHRPGYIRETSVSFNETPIEANSSTSKAPAELPAEASTGSTAHGLGIAMTPDPSSHASRGSGAHSIDSQTSSPPTHLVSPLSNGGRFSGSTKFDETFADTTYRGFKNSQNTKSMSSLQSGAAPSTYARSEAGLLSDGSPYNNYNSRRQYQSSHDVKGRLGNYVSVTILLLAAFSTAFSFIFLILALHGTRFSRIRTSGGQMTPASAAFLTSFFAKLIELSFVTVFVAFLGQCLARRAFKSRRARGVTLAEFSMRSWIMQPGVMLTQYESVRYAGITVLGALSLLAAVMAILYTTAATALVQPQLKFPRAWERRSMQGIVKTQFANPFYIQNTCKTPIQENYDAQYYQTTCQNLEHAAMAYHNYHGWLNTWTDSVMSGNSSMHLAERPKAFALLSDNTTITAPFIERVDSPEPWNGTGFINNVTLAYPHVGIVQAAIDPINRIMQPSDIDGASYHIRASVPSPFINVLCVTMQESDLNPFIYDKWPNRVEYNSSLWPHYISYPNGTDQYLNKTKFDHVFGWGPEYGLMKVPPVFPILPGPYQTIVNSTVGASWGRPTIYILGKNGPVDAQLSPIDNYALCQMQVGLTPACSTHYNASASGATMEAVCEDGDDDMQYKRSQPDALSGNDTLSKDWPNIASEWANSLSLNDGIVSANSSNSRLLTQMILGTRNLSTALPSMAEALGVLAGCTLIQSITDAPFTEFWNYTLTTIEPGQRQWFNASISAQQYYSGGTQEYQKAFYVVLFAVFLLNCLALLYICRHRDWYTDFSDPMNLFVLAVNSPTPERLAGTGGKGPRGDHFRMSWKLANDEGNVYMQENKETMEEPSANEENAGLRRRSRWTESFEMVKSPINSLKGRWSYTRASPSAEGPPR